MSGTVVAGGPAGHLARVVDADRTVRIVIVGTVRVRPAQRERFDLLMTSLRDGTVAEPGCVGFAFGPDASSPTGVLVQEEYTGHEALADHQAQPYVAAYAAALPDLLAEPVTFRIYEVAGRSTLSLDPSP